MTNKEWTRLAPWEEVVARSRGRAKYNSIRKLRAKVRRLAVVRRLRQVGFQRGVQRQLARELSVVPSVICTDVRRILTGDVDHVNMDETPQRPGSSDRSRQPKEEAMSQRCTIRLPEDLHARLQQAADGCGLDVSGMIRQALVSFLDGPDVNQGISPPTAQPVADPPHTTNDCLMATLHLQPPALQAEIEAMARRCGLPVLTVWQQRLYATGATLADTHPPPPVATKHHGIGDCVYVVLKRLPPYLHTLVSMWWALAPASIRADTRPDATATPLDRHRDASQPMPQHVHPHQV